MKTLTAKEEEIMGFFWEKGPMFVKQLVELYEEPPAALQYPVDHCKRTGRKGVLVAYRVW